MAPREELPSAAGTVADEHPEVWDAFARLGAAVSAAGPLDDRTKRLVKVALAMGAGTVGGTHSHVRRALAEGLTAEELNHIALLAVPTLGWPHAVAALTWVRDVTGQRGGGKPGGPSEG